MSVRKLSRMLFLINGLQFFLGFGILFGLLSNRLVYSEPLLELAVGLLLLGSLLSIAGILSVTRYQDKSYQESMENLEHLNLRLREQRHDYLNQIQIVYGLLEIGEYEEARKYLRPVFKDIMKVNRALRTAEPAVNALLQAKMEAAARQGVDLYLDVLTQLRDLAVEPWEFCKILANLIDNAVTAVSVNDGEKKVLVRLEEQKWDYRVTVQNNGPEIPVPQQKLIFKNGYTTKKGEGHGMGLGIVASVLKKAGGKIWLESSEEETTFYFLVPKQTAGRGAQTGGDHGKDPVVSSEPCGDNSEQILYK